MKGKKISEEEEIKSQTHAAMILSAGTAIILFSISIANSYLGEPLNWLQSFVIGIYIGCTIAFGLVTYYIGVDSK